MSNGTRIRILGLALLAATLSPATGSAVPFLYLAPGYTQELYASTPAGLGGFAFASDGDIWGVTRDGSGTTLIRFDAQTTILVHGTLVHPVVASASLPGKQGQGLANHPNGDLYLSTADGIVRLDAQTGGKIAESPPGSGCHGTSLASDPASPNHIFSVIPSAVSNVDPLTLQCLDEAPFSFQWGEAWDVSFAPAGSQYVLAFTALSNFDPPDPPMPQVHLFGTGSADYGVFAPLPAETRGACVVDGLAFVLASDLEGSIYRADLSGPHWGPARSAQLFASGGFPGGVLRRGADGCVFVIQYGTRYDDGTETSESSIVRICPNGVPARPTSWGRLKSSYR